MCANYRPVFNRSRLAAHFGVSVPTDTTWADDIRSMSLAPVIRRSNAEAQASPECFMAQFGLMPFWAKDPTIARRTFNARAETASTKANFKDAWAKGQRCVVPVEAIYGNQHGPTGVQRWQVQHRDGSPMGLAGLWSLGWSHNGAPVPSFAILTVEATEHPIFQTFQKPEDDKRMPVILDASEYEKWLDCPAEAMLSMMTLYPSASLIAEPVANDKDASLASQTEPAAAN